MSNERKILYVSAGINFTIGIIAGIILFFGQLRSGNSFSQNIYDYDRVVSITDFVRMTWINLVWMFSIFASRSMLSAKLIHPVLVVRGCVSSFTMLYILSCFGIKEAIASVMPQCFTVLPMLIMFSAETAVKPRKEIGDRSVIAIKKYEAVAILIFSIVAAGTEVMLFRVFCSYLF